MALTDNQIKSLKPTQKRYSKSDGGGLSIDVMPTGKKSWTLEYTKNGKRTRKKLGDYPLISLKEARALADKEKRLAILGLTDVTLQQVIDEWVNLHTPQWTSEKYKYTVMHRIELVTANLTNRPITDISRADISDKILAILERGTETAHRCLRILNSIFDYAIIKQYVQVNPCHLVDKLIPERKVKNMACLTFDEMPKFWQDINHTIAKHEIKQALMLYCYLAVRPNELAGAKWEEFDLDKAVWVIPAYRMKVRQEHLVPLAPQPLAILRALHEKRTNEFVFPHRLKPYQPMPIETPLALIKRAGYGGRMTTHGFRSLFSTYANESQLWTADVIERCLAHTPAGNVRHAYNRAEYLEHRTKLMTWWADIVEKWFNLNRD